MKDNLNSIDDKFLILENKFFGNIDNIKQLKLYPPENGICEAIVVYEVPDVRPLDDNGKYLSIDLGVNNMMTCFNSDSGETFIAGRAYQSISRLYNKKISEAQKRSISPSKISKLYEKKNNALNDYLHKVTRAVVNYSVANDISTVVIGDITGIRYGKDFGNKTNQKLHSFPYAKIYAMLEYKLKLKGISLFKQEESFTSQCSPKSPKVSKRYAAKKNRIQRGLYADGKDIWNADTVGAFNILRKFLNSQKKSLTYEQGCIKAPYVLKVAV